MCGQKVEGTGMLCYWRCWTFGFYY